MPNVFKLKNKYINKNSLLIMMLIFASMFTLIFNVGIMIYSPPQVVNAQVDSSKKEIDFWNNFLSVHPTYFEGWIELTNLYLNEASSLKALEAFRNAHRINPNSEKLIVLKLRLGLLE